MKILEKKCVICRKTFKKPKWASVDYFTYVSKYCSRKCLDNSKLGNTYRRGKKHPNIWNKGLSLPKGELNQSWRGNDAGYSAKHKWIKEIKGSPETCEHCSKTGLKKQQIHWANKDHKYKRILTDWIRLCAKCHQAYDRLNNNY